MTIERLDLTRMPTWPDVAEFNRILNQARLIEYVMHCDRIPVDNCLPPAPPTVSFESAEDLSFEAKRLYKSICNMLNDNRATKREIAWMNKHPALLCLTQVRRML